MGANNKINLKKCGEILIDINTKCSKNKTFLFYCTFCNNKCDQLQKFFLHIEEHLHSAEDVLKDTLIKFETEPEEMGIQSFSNNEKQDILNSFNSTYQSEEFLIREIKQEKETSYNNDAISDEEDLVYSNLHNDSDTDASGNSKFVTKVHHRKKIKSNDNIKEMDSDYSKDAYNDRLLTYFPADTPGYVENPKQTSNSISRKNISSRQVRDLESCRKKCKEKISKEEQQYIFNQYWSDGSYQYRQIFIANSINVEGTQTHTSKIRQRLNTYRYFLKLPNRSVAVCKKCFRYTLCEGDKFIKTTMKKKKLGKLGNLCI